MAPKSPPTGYSLTQILLHWAIALLVIFQLLFGEGMQETFDALLEGKKVGADDLAAANIHIYAGFAILALMVLRLIVRIARGVPPAPVGQSPIKLKIAAATQHTFYLVIFLMPIVGAIAWYFQLATVGEIHAFGKPVIVILLLIHFAGALMQHFVAKTDVLVRMLRPGASRPS